ncbi:hypothetical protein niasHT_033738 [Heterodera trifolii]|uniref:Uncharacterized protein n=1 Tax=Heterodera trifolii TaxID=157864 RepID=A0ABD2IC23_9BILA
MHGFDPRLPSEVTLGKMEDHFSDMAVYVQELTKRMEEVKTTVKENLRKCVDQMIKQQKWTKEIPWMEGMLVLKRRIDKRNKLEQNYDGPFRIITVEKPNLTLKEMHADAMGFTVHMDQCKPYFSKEEQILVPNEEPNSGSKRKIGDKNLEDTDGEEEIEINAISMEMLTEFDDGNNLNKHGLLFLMEIILDGIVVTALYPKDSFEFSSIPKSMVQSQWEIHKTKEGDEYLTAWVFEENIQLFITKEREDLIIGNGIQAWLNQNGNVICENGEATYWETYLDMDGLIYKNKITPEFWITHNEPKICEEHQFRPCSSSTIFLNAAKCSHSNLQDKKINTLPLSLIMANADSPILISDEELSDDEIHLRKLLLSEQQQQQLREQQFNPDRPYSSTVHSLPINQVQIVTPAQGQQLKRDQQLALINQKIKEMEAAKRQIEEEETAEEEARILKEKAWKAEEQKKRTKRELDEKEKKREEEKKAEERAKKDKEEVKAAFKKIGMSTEVGGKEDESKQKKKKSKKNQKGKDTENGNLEAKKPEDGHKMDDVLPGCKLGDEHQPTIEEEKTKKVAKLKKDAEEKAKRELGEAKAKKDAEEKAKREAKAKKDAEEKAKREAEEKKDAEEKAQREAKAKKDAEERAKREEKEKEAAAETKRDTEATTKIHSEKEEKGKREGNISINVEGAKKKIMETISEKWMPKIVGSIFDPRGEELGDDWTIKKCQENREKEDRLREGKSEERMKAWKEWTQPKNQWESGGTAQGGKRFFENTLKSAVISANEARAIPPEGMGWKRHVPCFQTAPPGPGFKRRYHDVSPIRTMDSTGQGTSAASGTEEKIVKIRKLLLQAADLLGEMADELFPYKK